MAQPSPDHDEHFLRRAVDLSVAGSSSGDGGPFGAVVVVDGEVVGEGWNEVLLTRDPTAHAEVVAIRRACQRLATFDLDGATMYASCEPCPMCWAATLWARCGRIVYANTRDQAAAIGFDDELFYEQMAVPLADRAVPMAHVPLPEAAAAFSAWAADPTRVTY